MQSPCRTPRRISIGTRSPSIVTLRHSLSLNSVPNCVCFNRVEGFFVINESDENWNPMIDRRVVLSKSCLFWRLRVVQDYGDQPLGCFADPQASIEHCGQRAEKGLLPELHAIFGFRLGLSLDVHAGGVEVFVEVLRNDFVFPVVYALLPDKSQVTYNRMLAMIKAEYPRFQTAQLTRSREYN
ncbi:hypothetical protein QR680_005649 [Steinernema hermaphroditum]|uniref:Uncharacterized protein n=1 Tax=Steinernema hermaphroditum TaxID=289476 RepID=A0AA39HV88_9BILA|nr:hypothetical protein QR680_005649 [Steinernema hermaphroditum]